MNLHPFHKYITNRDVNGHRDDMTLKEMVNQVGRNSGGFEYTPLMLAAGNEHFQVVKYLIEQGEADPNIADSDGVNALHLAAGWNRTNTELIELLLTHMSLNSINQKAGAGDTPLGNAYKYNDSPHRQEIIALLRLKGGKANKYDENGRFVGDGNGDLNLHFSDLPDVCQTIDTFISITTEMMGTIVQKMKLLDEEMNPGKNRMFYQNQVNVQALQARLLNTLKSVSKELCQKYGLTEKEYQDAENYYSSNRCAPEEQRIFRETIKQLQMQMQQTQQQIGLGM
eukprot:g10981.t1